MLTPAKLNGIVAINDSITNTGYDNSLLTPSYGNQDPTAGDGIYMNEINDPAEYYGAKAKLVEPVSIAFTATADITTDGGTSDCAATFTDWSGTGGNTNGIMYSIVPGTTGATIDATGLVQASGETGGDGSVTVICTTSNGISDIGLVTITNQVT